MRDRNLQKLRHTKTSKYRHYLVDIIKYTYGCNICKEDNPICLDFHHINPSIKINNISALIYRQNKISYMIREISKCNILCANCHSIEYSKLGYISKTHNIRTIQIRKRRIRNNNFINSLKDKCRKCGITNKLCLQFHHEKDKKYDISHMISGGYSIKYIQNEINKCIILCANCHRKEHYGSNGICTHDVT